MFLSISQVINQIMAQSAMCAVLNEEKCASLLTPDHDALLRLIVRQEFCRMGLYLAPWLSDVDLDSDNPDHLCLIFSDPTADDSKALAEELQTLLASATLGAALTCSGLSEGEHYSDLAAGALKLLTGRLSAIPRTSALSTHRY